MEKTLVLVKPDGVQRALMGEIISRLERRGLKLLASKFVHVTTEFAEEHYAAHRGKKFFNGLIKYFTSSPVLAMVWGGENVIAAVRQTVGATNPLEAAPGTIRHDYCLGVGRNLIHASDSPEGAEREINLWFKPEDIFEWTQTGDDWIYGMN